LFKDKSWCRVQKEISESSWFTFGLVLDGELKGCRADVIKILTEAGIQTRPLASRNFLKQPVMRDLEYIDNNNYDAANDIHDNGFFVGNGSQDVTKGLTEMYNTITDYYCIDDMEDYT